MPKPNNFLTAQEFAKTAGVSPATVSKWLREGTVSGVKRSGKWSISSAELSKVTPLGKTTKTPLPPPVHQSSPVAPASKTAAKSFSIREFSDLTYLTEFGVQKWLKEGRLKKIVDADGQVKVDGSSLEDPNVKRLLR